MNTKPMSTKTLFEAKLKVKPKRRSVLKFRRNKIESSHKCRLPPLSYSVNHYRRGDMIQCEECFAIWRRSDSSAFAVRWNRLTGFKLWWYVRKAVRENGHSNFV